MYFRTSFNLWWACQRRIKDMTKIKLIAIDMDGTLLNDNHEVTPNTLRTLQLVVEKGIYVVLATGRGMSRIKIHEELMALEQPIIAANGADIYYEASGEGEKYFIEKSSMVELFNIINEIKIPFWGFTENSLFENREISEEEMATCLKLGVQTNDFALLLQFYEKAKHIKNLEITKSAETNYEINELGVSKAYGVKKLCDSLNLSMDEVMCFGDSANDFKLFEVAGFPVAMENAIPELKEVAKAITVTNNDEGVSKAIQSFILNNE